MPFLTLVVALVAFVAFRSLTGSAILGSLSALLLMIQPEFQFVIQRGSHEKVTHMFVLTLIFLLGASVTRKPKTTDVVAYILIFYVVSWSLIATNSFFASSFIASLVLALAGGLVVQRIQHREQTDRGITQKLMYTALSCFALLFAFIAYVYSPARYNFGILRSVLDKLAVLFLSFQPQANPYASLGAGPGAAWAAPWVFPLLSAFNWTIVATAAITWVWIATRIVRTRDVGGTWRHMLLWLLAASFAVEVILSVATDLSGNLAGSNLELRLFPLFMLAGIPLAVVGISRILQKVATRWNRVLGAIGAALLLVFALTGIMKATNDPLVSNKWLFFTDYESRSLKWADANLRGQSIWVGYDERLLEMQSLFQPPNPVNANRYTAWNHYPSTLYITMSDVIRSRGPRLEIVGPDIQTQDRIFDDGGSQLYHRVPKTPYQP